MNRSVIILGSARGDGETFLLANYVAEQLEIPLIKLNEKNFGDYDYNYQNQDDDFFPLISEIVENYDTLIFATPVYWYSMSAIMKRFFDRFSDLIRIHKETGRQLRGKRIAVISSASEHELKDGFLMPFKESAKYLGMNYTFNVHGWVENGALPEPVIARLNSFCSRFKEEI